MNRFFLILAGLALTINCGYANLVAARGLTDLAQNADLIVFGTASGTFQSSEIINFTINVNRVVKGDPTMAGQAISVNWPSARTVAPLGTELTASGTGIWFLRQTSSQWVLYPVLDGGPTLNMAFFPAPPGPILSAYAYGAGTSVQDKLASEVSSAIEGSGGALSDQFFLLQFGLLDQFNSPVIQVLYQRLSTSQATQQKILGLSGLIRDGSSAALVSAIQSEPGFAGYAQNGILIASIRNEFRAADGVSLAALGAAAIDSSNPNSEFRAAVARALASIHTPATLPFLAALLGDPVAALRAEGIGGLAAFANALPVQTSAGVPSLQYLQLNGTNGPYRTQDTIQNFAQGLQTISRNEAQYLSFWGNWWSQNRASLGY